MVSERSMKGLFSKTRLQAKKKIHVNFIILTILIGFFALAMVHGAVTSNQTIHNIGVISYPSATPAPTPTPNANNLAPFGIYPNGAWSYTPYASKYSTVTWQEKTAIKLDCFGKPYGGNNGEVDRELDVNTAIRVNLGDTIVFKAWFWVPDSTIGDNGNPLRGGALEIDPYQGSQYINPVYLDSNGGSISGNGVPAVVNGAWAHNPKTITWGTNQWVQMSLTWKVTQLTGCGIGSSSATQLYTPDNVYVVLYGCSTNPGTEQAPIYITGTELYIYPAIST